MSGLVGGCILWFPDNIQMWEFSECQYVFLGMKVTHSQVVLRIYQIIAEVKTHHKMILMVILKASTYERVGNKLPEIQ